jgi:hypothetical protein
MAIVTELELPEFDYLADDLTGEVYHRRLAAVRSQGWLASSPLSYIVLDREAGEFFLRSKGTAFPGREIADLFGASRSTPTSSTSPAIATGGCAPWSGPPSARGPRMRGAR